MLWDLTHAEIAVSMRIILYTCDTHSRGYDEGFEEGYHIGFAEGEKCAQGEEEMEKGDKDV